MATKKMNEDILRSMIDVTDQLTDQLADFEKNMKNFGDALFLFDQKNSLQNMLLINAILGAALKDNEQDMLGGYLGGVLREHFEFETQSN